MRRALEYARGLGVTLAQHCEDGALACDGGHARGRVVEPAGHSRDAGGGRGGDGRPRHRPVRLDRRADALPAPVDGRLGRSGARGQGGGPAGDRRGGTSPLHPHRRRGRRLRPGVQGQPAVADRDRTWPRSRPALADGTIDAIATDHAPHTPEAKDLPLDQAPPGMLGLETALASGPRPSWTCPSPGSWPCCRGSRRPSPGSADAATAARSSPGRPANLCVFDPAATWTVDAGRLASRSRNTPYAGGS